MNKECSKCKETKPILEFHGRSDRLNKKHAWCKSCKNAANREWKIKNLEHAKEYQQNYIKKNKEKITLQMRVNSKKWYEKNKEKALKRCRGHELRKFWPELTLEQCLDRYNSMLIAQDYKCQICSKTPVRKLNVDHCHTTGKVRGLLCGNCNRGLGLFFDNPDLMLSAIKYVS